MKVVQLKETISHIYARVYVEKRKKYARISYRQSSVGMVGDFAYFDNDRVYARYVRSTLEIYSANLTLHNIA